MTGTLNYVWASLLVEELYRHGVSFFCLSPGSRCTPLTVAIARHPHLKKIIHFDERGGGFVALGIAKGGNISVLVSTSGTAVANYLPAVVEASKSCLPFILLTADRPPELRDSGANQSIDQVKIFQNYVRWSIDLPPCSPDVDPAMVLTTVDQAIRMASHSPQGPVQINCMFREPFLPSAWEENNRVMLAPSSRKFTTRISEKTTGSGNKNDLLRNLSFAEIPKNYFQSLQEWFSDTSPYTPCRPFCHKTREDSINEIALLIKENKTNGLLILGGMENQDREAILHFARYLGWPVYADISSGVRFGYNEKTIGHFELLLQDAKTLAAFSPAVVVQIGSPLLSKNLLRFLKNISPKAYFIINNTPFRANPWHCQLTYIEEENYGYICRKLARILKDDPQQSGNNLKKIQQLSRNVEDTINRIFQEQTILTEPEVARIISQHIPRGSGLFLGASMPIRHMNCFAKIGISTADQRIMVPKEIDNNPIHIAANRGASGIDGTVASAIGFGYSLSETVTVFLGDIALLHDLNSLSLLSHCQYPVIIIVLNNHGGGIFSFLPISHHHDFEMYFGTPHSFTFEEAAKMFHLPYAMPKTKPEFVHVYQKALSKNKSMLIEIVTDRETNVAFYQKVKKQIQENVF